MFGLGIGAKVSVGLAVLMALGGYGFYLYYEHTQERMQEQAAEIALVRMANENLADTVAKKDEALSRQIENLNRLNREVATIRKEAGDMAELLSRHDLRYLAAKKPGLIERRVNSGTKDVFNQLKALSDPETYEVKKDEDQ